jgi:hypothetical protein
MMGHGSALFTIVCRIASNRQSRTFHDITGIESSVHYRYHKHSRILAEVMEYMLCRSLSRMDSADNLLDILGCRNAKIELPMLGAAFFERGVLASSVDSIAPIDVIALGDIGYVTEARNFVVVDNVHQYLQAKFGTLDWTWRRWVRSGGEDIGDTPTENIVSQSGKCYQRRRQARLVLMLGYLNNLFIRLCLLTMPAKLLVHVDLEYTNLDETHGWKLLQHDAHSITAQHGLSIPPHELKLGQCCHNCGTDFDQQHR